MTRDTHTETTAEGSDLSSSAKGNLDILAGMYEREVDYELKTLSSKIEPILIVGLGILVLILALGVFLPIWDLGKAAMHK